MRTFIAVTARVLLYALAAFAALTRAASGQEASPPTLEPPAVVRFVEAPYPEAARAAGRQGAVELEILIDVAGTVADARVVTPIGDGFDEAALEAVRRFEWKPAQRNGQPVAARIRYRYVFELPPPPPPPPAPEPEPTPSLPALGAKAEPPPEEPLSFGGTARIDAPPREVTKRSLDQEELVRMPGTRGDALRAIEILPGVGRPPGGSDLVIIRGASPLDSEAQLEGAPVYRLYHFGGLTSFTHSRLLERIDLYPGNFSVRYGRRMGGIIDVGLRDPRRDGYHGIADLNIIDASILAEGPLGKRGAVAIAAKRSHIDLVFDGLVPEEAMSVVAAPVYSDYQFLATYNVSDKDKLKLSLYGSSDRFKLILAEPVDGDPDIRGGFSSNTAFYRAQLSWRRRYSDVLDHEISVTGGRFLFGTAIGPQLSQDIRGWDLFTRSEWRLRAHERLRIVGGLDVTNAFGDFRYTGPRVQQFEGNPGYMGALTGKERQTLDTNLSYLRPAAYLEASFEATSRLTLIAGLRGDHFGEIDRTVLDPRLVARWRVVDGTTLKAGAGRFSQAPDYGESIAGIGNPRLRAPWAEHYSFGIEQAVGAATFSAEAFAKRSHLLIVNSPVPGENLTNFGRGRIFGGEFSGRVRAGTRGFAYASYTLSRSERNDRDEGWRLFDYDQRHILTLAGSYRLGRGWELGTTFRFVSGNPTTPVIGSTYNANLDLYSPRYGALNSGRNADFHRLDLRIEKVWQPRWGKIAAYLDVQNAYNRKNEEGRSYNYDFRQSQAIPGLPVIPSLGVRGEI